MTQQVLEDLFADLRADTIHTVRAPGVAAAHRTVRRRRQTRRTAGVVGVGAVVVAVGLSWPVATGHRRPDELINPPRDLAAAARTALDRAASGAVAFPTTRVGNFDSYGPWDDRLPLAQADGLLDRAAEVVTQLTPGSYQLFLACSSTVSAMVTVVIRSARSGRQDMSAVAPCAVSGMPEVSQPGFQVSGTAPERVTISVLGTAPSGTAIGYAYKVVLVLPSDRAGTRVMPDGK